MLLLWLEAIENAIKVVCGRGRVECGKFSLCWLHAEIGSVKGTGILVMSCLLDSKLQFRRKSRHNCIRDGGIVPYKARLGYGDLFRGIKDEVECLSVPHDVS